MTGNRAIYNAHYTADQLDLPTEPYDRHIADARLALVREFAPGRDVLDLCCGTGAYLMPGLDAVRSAVGVDFSGRMLHAFREKLGGRIPGNLALIEADATALPLAGGLFDFVFSFTALYYIENLDAVIREVARVLRPGGHAALEFGNSTGLTPRITRKFHHEQNWALTHPAPLGQIHALLGSAGLKILGARRFQIVPLFGAPRGMRYLRPFTSPRLKPIFGARLCGRTVDEILSSSWPLKNFAFRHILVVKKP
jgi:SAM-dependent methyltransferase